MALTHKQMQAFLQYGWGGFGDRIYRTWTDYNERYFDGALKPIAIVPAPTLPYEACVGPHHPGHRAHHAGGTEPWRIHCRLLPSCSTAAGAARRRPIPARTTRKSTSPCETYSLRSSRSRKNRRAKSRKNSVTYGALGRCF